MDDNGDVILVMQTIFECDRYLESMCNKNAIVRVVIDENLETNYARLEMIFDGVVLEVVVYVNADISLYTSIIEYEKATFRAVYLYSEWQASKRPMLDIIDEYKEYFESDERDSNTDKFIQPYVDAYLKFVGGNKHG